MVEEQEMPDVSPQRYLTCKAKHAMQDMRDHATQTEGNSVAALKKLP
jgi:hypothetical protein